MSAASLKDRLRNIVGIHTLTVGPSSVTLNNQTIPIPAHASDDEIAAAIQSNIQKINAITGQPTTMTTTITGASQLAGTIKDRINAAKAKVGTVTANADAALAKLNSAADTADQVNQAISKEADDLMAQIGQFTNGGPT